MSGSLDKKNASKEGAGGEFFRGIHSIFFVVAKVAVGIAGISAPKSRMWSYCEYEYCSGDFMKPALYYTKVPWEGRGRDSRAAAAGQFG